MFIGFYNLANTVTLLGLASAIMAIFCSSQGNYKLALVMFLFAGLCDMFDGRIARSTPKKLNREKVFGIQIDSLADLVSFGVVPTMMVYNMGYGEVGDLIIYLFFISCGAIRLAFFNTLAMSATADNSRPYYIGLPIPMSCVLMPLFMLFTALLEPSVTQWLFRLFFILVGLAYILRIEIKKPSLKACLGFVAFDVVCLIIITLIKDFKLPI